MGFMTEVDEAVKSLIDRYAWARWPAKKAALNRASYKEGFRRWFKCEKCGKDKLQGKDVHCHHLVPRIDGETGWEDLNTYAYRTLCKVTELLIVCKDCHNEIHKGDSKVRWARKKVKARLSKVLRFRRCAIYG